MNNVLWVHRTECEYLAKPFVSWSWGQLLGERQEDVHSSMLRCRCSLYLAHRMCFLEEWMPSVRSVPSRLSYRTGSAPKEMVYLLDILGHGLGPIQHARADALDWYIIGPCLAATLLEYFCRERSRFAPLHSISWHS